MPKGLIARLTVRLHRFVGDPDLAWITGVLFQRNTTSVLVEISSDGRYIELRARGPEDKALLSVVAADLKLIPCRCSKCRADTTPQFFEEASLLRRKEAHRLQVECERSFELVHVLELLDEIRVSPVPTWAHPEQKPTP